MKLVVAGADACAGGWVVVRLRGGTVEDVEVVDHLRVVGASGGSGATVIGVDIPIGLTASGRRDADRAARGLLPGRASSVFNAPPRAVVDGWREGTVTTHAMASSLTREHSGAGLSQQTWRLVPRIAEVDALVAEAARTPAPATVVEVHPEVAFAVVVGEPLPRKRSWAGITTRRAVLDRLGVRVPDRFIGDVDAAPDDVLDAAICAWVAAGLATGEGILAVPGHTDQQDHGRAIQILARVPPPVPRTHGGPA